ncbi:ribbon-helix-helix protein, CopG family [Ligilactobacillus salivarius]
MNERKRITLQLSDELKNKIEREALKRNSSINELLNIILYDWYYR